MSLDRLGASDPFGDVFLDLLELQGWEVSRRPAFGARGILIHCDRDGRSFMVRGEDLAEAAIAAFKMAAAGHRQVA